MNLSRSSCRFREGAGARIRDKFSTAQFIDCSMCDAIYTDSQNVPNINMCRCSATTLWESLLG